MAERALLVRYGESGRWDVCRSRWGGTDRALSAVCAGVVPSALPVTWEYDRSTGSFVEAVAGLDYLGTELLYRTQRTTTAFLTLWFGLPVGRAHPDLEAGTAVEVRSLDDARRVRGAFREYKGRLADALERGAIPAAATPIALVGSVHRLHGRERYVVWRDVGPCDILYSVARPPRDVT